MPASMLESARVSGMGSSAALIKGGGGGGGWFVWTWRSLEKRGLLAVLASNEARRGEARRGEARRGLWG